MDGILRKFSDDALAALDGNLVCLLHHGSRAKCEAHAESDYDFIIVVKSMNEKAIRAVQNLLLPNPKFTVYMLSVDELETWPRGHLLEFLYAKKLYGKLDVEMPTPEEVKQYLSHCRREELSSIRHYLILPHPPEKKAKVTYYLLKFAYVYLSFLAFTEAGKLPHTRKETIAFFEHRNSLKESNYFTYLTNGLYTGTKLRRILTTTCLC